MLYNGQVAIGAFIFATILVVFNALLVQQGDESINGGGEYFSDNFNARGLNSFWEVPF